MVTEKAYLIIIELSHLPAILYMCCWETHALQRRRGETEMSCIFCVSLTRLNPGENY